MKDTDLEERLLRPVCSASDSEAVCAQKLVGDADGWQISQVIDWLQTDGRFAPNVPLLLEALSKKLNEVGAPVWRAMIGYRTLHPKIAVEGAVWTRGKDSVVRRQADHGIWPRDTYVGSPVEQVNTNMKSMRWRLDNLTEDDIWDWNWDAGPVFRNETDIDECDAWVYDQSEFTKTAVSEVNVQGLFKL